MDHVFICVAQIDGDVPGDRVEQLQLIGQHLVGFTASSSAINKMMNPRSPIGPGYMNTIARLNRAPGLIQERKESCVRGGARIALALLACHQLGSNLWHITKGFPKKDCKGNLVDTGYTTKVGLTCLLRETLEGGRGADKAR
jgi:hypothetical protein